MKGRLHQLIFVGMVAGLLAGMALWKTDDGGALHENAIWLADLFGKTLFIGALKMIVTPLVFFSILAAIVSLPTTGELWRVGWKTLLFYLATTSIAVAIGLILVLAVRPGDRGDREGLRASWEQKRAEIHQTYGAKEEKVVAAKSRGAREAIKTNLQNTIMNPVKAMAEGQTLGVIFFAILLGVALIVLREESAAVLPVIKGINAAIMKVTVWIMAGSPFFVFCLITSLVASHGPEVFQSLAWYVGTVIAGIALHVVVLLLICRFLGGMSPLRFLRGIRRAWMVAFSTRSSAATLPVTLDCVKDDLGVNPKAANFILPLGATVNMDGTALYEGVAVIFLVQLFGGMAGAQIELTAVMTVIVFVTAVLASIGAAAVPDAGLVTMVLVANAVGLSVEYIPMIFAVDAFLDMFRTSTNVMGDAVGAVVVGRLEGERLEAG